MIKPVAWSNIIRDMARTQLERWQIALNNWDTWTSSIIARRQRLIDKFGDLEVIKEQLDDLTYRAEALHNLSNSEAEELKKLTKAHTEIVLKTDDVATDFIIGTMGIPVTSRYHNPIFRYWMSKAIPEFLSGFADDIDFSEYLRKEGLIHVWREPSKIEKVHDKEVVVDSISWYRGKASPEDIAEMAKDERVISDLNLVLKRPWPTYESLDAKRKGGRPRKKPDEDDMNAVICRMLYMKFNIKQQPVLAAKFRLKKPSGHSGIVSTTIKRWLAKGKRLIDFEIEDTK